MGRSDAKGSGGSTIVLLICGLPGSGKSTLAASLAGKGWSQVSQDELGTQDEMTKALEKHLKHGRSVIIDRCCVTPSERKTWVRRAHAACAKGHSVRVEAVFLDVPAELCKHRVRTRTNHPTLGPDSADVVDEFCRGLKAPEKWEGPYDACCVVACDADLKTVKARYADPKSVNAKEVPAGKGAWEIPAAVAGAGPSSGKGAAACNLYVVRHGERTDRVAGEHVENHHDCQITTAGKAQARKAGEFISNHLHSTGGLGKVDAVYTSPFFRCVQTAAEVAGQVGVPNLRVEPGLGELFAKRLFEAQPVLTRPSTVLRSIEPLGIGLDQSVAPLAATLPVWPEPGKAASKRVRDTVLALMQRHAGQTIVLAVHAHGLVEASSSVPKRAAANVQSMPGYCAVTHVDSAGFADVVTDLGYRGGTTGSYVSTFLGQPLQPPPPAAGAFSNTWEWKSAPKSAAAAASAGAATGASASPVGSEVEYPDDGYFARTERVPPSLSYHHSKQLLTLTFVPAASEVSFCPTADVVRYASTSRGEGEGEEERTHDVSVPLLHEGCTLPTIVAPPVPCIAACTDDQLKSARKKVAQAIADLLADQCGGRAVEVYNIMELGLAKCTCLIRFVGTVGDLSQPSIAALHGLSAALAAHLQEPGGLELAGKTLTLQGQFPSAAASTSLRLTKPDATRWSSLMRQPQSAGAGRMAMPSWVTPDDIDSDSDDDSDDEDSEDYS
eukprot:Rhum_TRINITY_DN15092_c15_g1::Rhum_TRINITY_DN15092_c15_g1_i1::g.137704::m.137704